MPIVERVDPKTIFTPEEWARLTSRNSWRGMWLVVHCWGTIIAAVALVTVWPNPFTWLLAVMVVGVLTPVFAGSPATFIRRLDGSRIPVREAEAFARWRGW